MVLANSFVFIDGFTDSGSKAMGFYKFIIRRFNIQRVSPWSGARITTCSGKLPCLQECHLKGKLGWVIRCCAKS